MPTYAWTRQFKRDFDALGVEQRRAFREAVGKFIKDLSTRKFRKGLRVKGIKGAPGLFEMTWAEDGRATFEFGPPVLNDEPHIIWRRVGTHAIFDRP